jgi:hypothetical protein
VSVGTGGGSRHTRPGLTDGPKRSLARWTRKNSKIQRQHEQALERRRLQDRAKRQQQSREAKLDRRQRSSPL